MQRLSAGELGEVRRPLLPPDLLGFGDFVGNLAVALDVEVLCEADRDVRLREDLGLDSLALLEVCVFLEDLGAEVPEELAAQLVTIGDLYHHYRTRASAAR